MKPLQTHNTLLDAQINAFGETIGLQKARIRNLEAVQAADFELERLLRQLRALNKRRDCLIALRANVESPRVEFQALAPT